MVIQTSVKIYKDPSFAPFHDILITNHSDHNLLQELIMHISKLLLAYASTAAAFCPMAELARRGLAPEELKEAYLQGKGLGKPHETRQNNNNPAVKPLPGVLSSAELGSLTSREKRQDNPAPILDPLSGVLSSIGLGSLVPRSPRSEEHSLAIEDHIRSRLDERDEDVDIDAKILSPKAHKRHVEERGLLGGILAPLTGVLAALDLPTPQRSGLKAIPGNVSSFQKYCSLLSDC